MTEAIATGGLAVVRPTPLTFAPRSSQGLTLISDIHLGSAGCDLDLLQRDLTAAKRHKDRILLGGDVFDLVLPGDTRRYDPSRVHPRVRGRADAVNAAVEWGLELFGPYADLIDVVGDGNHEAEVKRRRSVDALRLLVEGLQAKRSPLLAPIHHVGYTAFVDYRAQHPDTGKTVGHYTIWFTHGSGRVSSAHGAIKALREKAHSFSADLYWSGHSHARVSSTEVVIYPGRGRPVWKDVRCVVTGSYLVGYGAQSEGSLRRRGPRNNYASEAAMAPHGLGGARVVLHWDRQGSPARVEVIQ